MRTRYLGQTNLKKTQAGETTPPPEQPAPSVASLPRWPVALPSLFLTGLQKAGVKKDPVLRPKGNKMPDYILLNHATTVGGQSSNAVLRVDYLLGLRSNE